MGLEYINPATSGSRRVFPLLGTHRLRSPVSPPSSMYLIHVQRHSIFVRNNTIFLYPSKQLVLYIKTKTVGIGKKSAGT